MQQFLAEVFIKILSSEKDGMVLKWYLNSRTVFYISVDGHLPLILGAMRGRIYLDFEITSDPYTRHRALYIYNQTVEMSGEYTCKVSTLENEVSVTNRMVVYTPPRRVAVQHRRSSYNSVNISCFVDHAFPRPSDALHH